jgi:hypothetical protein
MRIIQIPAPYSRNVEREEEDMAVIQAYRGDMRTGGLKESLAKFNRHHNEEAGQLLNISGIDTVDERGNKNVPVDKDDPRQPYVHQAFPRMVFHAERKPAIGNCEPGEAVAVDQKELDALLAKGYRAEPYPRPQVHLEDPKQEKAALQRELREKDGELATLRDAAAKMMARLDALESAATDPNK